MALAAASLESHGWDKGAPPALLLSLSDALTSALKLCSLTLSTLEQGRGTGGARTGSTFGDTPSGAAPSLLAPLAPSLNSISQHCKGMLQWEACPKELRTAAAVALAGRICFGGDAAAAALCDFLGGAGGEGGVGAGRGPNSAWFFALPLHSRLALLRGLLICASPLLLYSACGEQLYIEVMWGAIDSAFASPDVNFRVDAVQVSETLLSAVRRIVAATATPHAAATPPGIIQRLEPVLVTLLQRLL